MLCSRSEEVRPLRGDDREPLGRKRRHDQGEEPEGHRCLAYHGEPPDVKGVSTRRRPAFPSEPPS